MSNTIGTTKKKAHNLCVVFYWKDGPQIKSKWNSHLKNEEAALNWARKLVLKYLGRFNYAYINDRRKSFGSDKIESYDSLGNTT